jgi:hypothetical protein
VASGRLYNDFFLLKRCEQDTWQPLATVSTLSTPNSAGLRLFVGFREVNRLDKRNRLIYPLIDKGIDTALNYEIASEQKSE